MSTRVQATFPKLPQIVRRDRQMKGLRITLHGLSAGPVIAVIVALILGTLIGRYRVFPYQLMAAVKHSIVRAERSPTTSSPEYVDRIALFANTVGGADLVMLGDSIVAYGDWIDLAQDSSIANRGISGDTIEGLRARLGDVLRLGPASVYLMIGVNDFLSNRSVDEVHRDYVAVLDVLQDANITVVVQATLHVGTRNPYFYEINKKIERLNKGLVRAAEDRGFTFFDTNAALAPLGVLSGVFTEDGVHLNYRGYACWTKALRVAQDNEWSDESQVPQDSLPECQARGTGRMASM